MSRNGWLPYDITKRLLKRFVKHLEEKERADATVKKYQQHIRVLFDEWHKAGHDVVELPTTESMKKMTHLIDVHAEMEGLSAKTKISYCSVLRSLKRWFVFENIADGGESSSMAVQISHASQIQQRMSYLDRINVTAIHFSAVRGALQNNNANVEVHENNNMVFLVQ